MNILNELIKRITVKTLLGEETYCFLWITPATLEAI